MTSHVVSSLHVCVEPTFRGGRSQGGSKAITHAFDGLKHLLTTHRLGNGDFTTGGSSWLGDVHARAARLCRLSTRRRRGHLQHLSIDDVESLAPTAVEVAHGQPENALDNQRNDKGDDPAAVIWRQVRSQS